MNGCTQNFEPEVESGKKETMFDRASDALSHGILSILGMAGIWNATYIAAKLSYVKDVVAIVAGLTTIVCTVLVARRNLKK